MSQWPFLDPECLNVISAAGGCLVAVSGGADSIMLLHALAQWAESFDGRIRLSVVHVNHGLRGAESDADAAFVEEVCRKLRLASEMRRTASADGRSSGMTLEEFLRKERHAAFRDALEATGHRVLALGHTADDLAETFLMHLFRGTGLRGLTFHPVTLDAGAGWIRPLWRTSRARVSQWLTQHELLYREDSSNVLPEFTRNRVRHLLLPLLQREFNPAIRESLTRTAGTLGRAQDFLQQIVTEHLHACVSERGPHRLNLTSFRGLHAYLQEQVLDEWIRSATNNRVRLTSSQSAAVARLAACSNGRLSLPSGYSVVPGAEELVLLSDSSESDEHGESQETRKTLATLYQSDHPELFLGLVPDSHEIRLDSRGGEWRGEMLLLDGRVARVAVGRTGTGREPEETSLQLRNRRPGDRFTPSSKLKEVLIKDKVPAFIRDFLLVVATPEGQVLHVIGMTRLNGRLRERLPLADALQVTVSCPD